MDKLGVEEGEKAVTDVDGAPRRLLIAAFIELNRIFYFSVAVVEVAKVVETYRPAPLLDEDLFEVFMNVASMGTKVKNDSPLHEIDENTKDTSRE